ncbi:uncharacterized protein LOC123507468 [Portunus trituberculatus]|uniref:Transmembrane protein 272 n=1 Tax=Portunus trituberculatus TaxID=210409 RepID=A0A5B7DEE1_PORTR|nr:uncharacterized protein LOC123507468 [Portunus trituberculatus]XP_045116302.1 uncharacterized protein LOC123507468 [Portunus trituberculatus]MPC19623.1 hypothetical protein [Portunus trituberculatus]
MECDGSSSAATTPGEAATTTTTTTTVTTAPLDTPTAPLENLETPTTPLPPPSDNTITTTDNIFSLEEPPGPPPVSSFPFRMHHAIPSGPPPSYDECHNRDSPPPTYDSLFGRVREVQKTSNGILDLIKNLIILFVGTVGCTVMIGVTIVIPVFMIILGSLKMNDCPAQPYIPIYLVVGGVLGVTKPVLGVQGRLHRPLTDEEGADLQDASVPWHRRLEFSGSINFFLSAWFIMGCVWVYRIYEPDYSNKGASNYCDQILYQFAFWLVTSVYIIVGLLISCVCGLSIATVVLQHSRGAGEVV